MAAKKQPRKPAAAKTRKFVGRVLKKDERQETPAQILRGAVMRFFARFDLM